MTAPVASRSLPLAACCSNRRYPPILTWESLVFSCTYEVKELVNDCQRPPVLEVVTVGGKDQ